MSDEIIITIAEILVVDINFALLIWILHNSIVEIRKS